jgi:hypothetical protein
LAVTTSPGDAEVFVDDIRRGTSDAVRGKLLIEGLTAGLHTVRVLKNGYNEYRINVSLEDGRPTDLQIALPARSTVAIPRGEDTAAAEFDTLKLHGADDPKAALLVVESVPAGSTVFVGSNAVGQVGDDGRATIKLNPGAHEVRVTAPSGASARRVVTVTPEDSGSLKTIALPVGGATSTTRAAVPSQTQPSGRGKQIAVAATIILLLALVAAAYYVIRGPGHRVETPPNQPEQQAALIGETASPSKADTPEAVVKKPETDSAKVVDAEKAALEKKLAEAEKKLAAEKKAADKIETKPEPSTPAAVAPSKPVLPEPPKQQPAPVVSNNACIAVSIKGRDGLPAAGVRVGVKEEAPNSGGPLGGRTGPLGRWQSCGLSAGSRVSVGVFGPRGALLGAKQGILLERGQNFVEIQVNRGGETDEQPFERGRKRLRFPRQ